jgi:hypothetical protein
VDPNRNRSDDPDPLWYSERTYVDKPWQAGPAERYPLAEPRDDVNGEPATDRFGDDPLGLGGRYPESGRLAAAEPSSAAPFAAPGSASRPPFAPPGSASRPPFAPPGSASGPPYASPASGPPFASPASGPPFASPASGPTFADPESVSGPPSPDPVQRTLPVEQSAGVEAARPAEPTRSTERRNPIDGPMPPVTPRSSGDGPPAAEYGRRVAPAGPVSDGVYRSSRPALAIFFAVLVMIFEVPALRMLLDGALADPVQVGAVVAGTALMTGLPLFAVGLLGLATGATKVGHPVEAWLKPPTAHLLVGLVLFVVAGLAAG